MTKSLIWPALAGLIIAALLLGLLLVDPRQENPAPYANMGGDFTLESINGPVSLSDFEGKYVILYFGYTSCPDICPTSLGALSMALNQLAPEDIRQIQGLFISVDPARDTPDKLQAYAAYFHPVLLGVTGSPDALQKIAGQYGAYFHKVEIENSLMDYAMDHSSTLFLVDRKGALRDMVLHSNNPELILKQIRALMNQ